MDAQWSAEHAAEVIIREAWNATQTTEEAIRDYLVAHLGRAWRKCMLNTTTLLDKRVIYQAILLRPVTTFEDNFVLESFTIDRDSAGRFYMAAPSPVAGYE
jgi:hypothetical protein